MAIRYHSSDVSAPQLSGQVGAWIAILDAVLVGTAGVAYGSTASAGWTKAYAGTNLAVYRNSLANGGTGCYLRVDDTNAQFARVTVFATMSDINTGTDMTPSTGQISGGAYWHKSSAASSATREWCIVADSLTMYAVAILNQLLYSTSTTRYSNLMGAGDFATIQPSDGYRYFCFGAHNSTSTGAQSIIQQNGAPSASAFTTYYGATTGRDYLGNAASSTVIGMSSPIAGGGNGLNPVVSSLPGSSLNVVIPAMVTEGVCYLRGRWRGLYSLYGQGPRAGIGNLVPALTDPAGVPLVELCIFNGNGTANGSVMASSGVW